MIVGDGAADRDFAGALNADALGHQLRGVDQQPGGGALLEAVLAQLAHLLAELREVGGRLEIDATLVRDDARFELLRG